MLLVRYYPALSGYWNCSHPQDLETIERLSTNLVIYKKKLIKQPLFVQHLFLKYISSGFMTSTGGYCCLASIAGISQPSHWPCCCPSSLTHSWPCLVDRWHFPWLMNRLSFCFLCCLLFQCLQFSMVLG